MTSYETGGSRLSPKNIRPLAGLLLATFASGALGEEDPRIAAVENGLLPRVVVHGNAGKPLRLADRMAEAEVPGLSLAVIDDGEIAWVRGYGVKNIESGEPVTSDTLFLAGSISKPVAAVGALRLLQEGRLDLDADVNEYLVSWRLPRTRVMGDEDVSLRRLLTHTAGLTVHGFGGYQRSTDLPSVPQILDGDEPANTPAVRADLKPGSQWRYSGGGYTIMQLLVEDTAGQPFEEYLERVVLLPFGMTSSSFENPLDAARHSSAASGYYPSLRKVVGDWHVYPEMAAAGLWTTAGDLARYAIGVQKAAAGESEVVLKADTTAAMLTPHLRDWGLGPSLSGEGKARRFGHDGRDEGFDALLVAYVETGDGVAILINANDNSGLLSEIAASVARAYDWVGYPEIAQKEYFDLSSDKLSEYEGSYERADGEGNLRIFVWRDKLWLTPQIGTRLELMADAEADSFFLRGPNAPLTFSRGVDGEIEEMSFNLFGVPGTATRK